MRLDAEQRKSLEEARLLYMSQMDEEALSYLNGRGIDSATAEEYSLGRVVNPLPEHGMYRGRIAIPVIKKAGTTGFKFRCIEPHDCKKVERHDKYLSRGPQQMYNVRALENRQKLIAITEGEFDAIVLDGVVGIPAVALPGAKSWKGHPWWRHNLEGFRRILIFADNDAGKERNYGSELADAIVSDLPHAEIILLPDPPEGESKMDVTDTLMSYGPGYLCDLAGV